MITPDKHLSKKGGCRQCKSNAARSRHGKSRETFIAEAQVRHGDLYDYKDLVYVNAKTHVVIHCRKHKVRFEQTPDAHLSGSGCPGCKRENIKQGNALNYAQRSVDFDEFLNRARATHGSHYQYDRSSYTGFGENVNITCPSHGVFRQRAERHAKGSECRRCAIDKLKITEPTWRSRIEEQFGATLSVLLPEGWSGFQTPVQASCSRHNHAWRLNAGALLNGTGCRHCVREQKNQPRLQALRNALPSNLDYLADSQNPEFLSFAMAAFKTHASRYHYRENHFVSFSRQCQVTCAEHQAFKILPQEHLDGAGCPVCDYQRTFIAAARERFADRFDYTSTRFSHAHAKDRISVRCIKHDTSGTLSAEAHLRDTPFCSQCRVESRAVTTAQRREARQASLIESFKQQAYAAHTGKYEYPKLEDELVTRVSKITVYCPTHEYTFTPSAAAHVQTGNRSPAGCQRCKGDASRLRYRTPYDQVKARLATHGFTLLTEAEAYLNQREAVLVRCNEGHELDVIAQKIFSGRGCPHCSPYVGEAITRSVLEEGLGIALLKRRFKQKDHPDLISPHASLELDGYNASQQIAFEYQGAWHSQRLRHRTEESYRQQLQRDAQKVVMCSALEIKLIIVHEFTYPFDATDVRQKILSGLQKVELEHACSLPDPLPLQLHIQLVNAKGLKQLQALAAEHNLTVKETAWHGNWHDYSWTCNACQHAFKAQYTVRKDAKWKCCPKCARNLPEVKAQRKQTMKSRDGQYLASLRERALKLGLELLDNQWRSAQQNVTYRFRCVYTQQEVGEKTYNSILVGSTGCRCEEHRRMRGRSVLVRGR